MLVAPGRADLVERSEFGMLSALSFSSEIMPESTMVPVVNGIT